MISKHTMKRYAVLLLGIAAIAFAVPAANAYLDGLPLRDAVNHSIDFYGERVRGLFPDGGKEEVTLHYDGPGNASIFGALLGGVGSGPVLLRVDSEVVGELSPEGSAVRLRKVRSSHPPVTASVKDIIAGIDEQFHLDRGQQIQRVGDYREILDITDWKLIAMAARGGADIPDLNITSEGELFSPNDENAMINRESKVYRIDLWETPQP